MRELEEAPGFLLLPVRICLDPNLRSNKACVRLLGSQSSPMLVFIAKPSLFWRGRVLGRGDMLGSISS